MKDYRAWMLVKSSIHNSPQRPEGFKKGEIWICSIGENVGYENDGKGKHFARPVLILKSHSNRTCHIVPLSTTTKRGIFYYPFEGHTGQTSVALLTQSRTIDTARLKRKIGSADKADFDEIRKRVKGILNL